MEMNQSEIDRFCCRTELKTLSKIFGLNSMIHFSISYEIRSISSNLSIVIVSSSTLVPSFEMKGSLQIVLKKNLNYLKIVCRSKPMGIQDLLTGNTKHK